jgi:hypothetical protein
MGKKKYQNYLFLILIAVSLLLKSCVVNYSLLSPATVPTEAKTFSVPDFVNAAVEAPPFLNRLYSDALIAIIENQSRLRYVPDGGDLVFEGRIVGYQIDIINIQSNSQAADNTLTVRVKVKYTNPFDENKNFDQEFSDKERYPANQQLTAVEGAVNQPIVDKVVQDIFDKAFGEW